MRSFQSVRPHLKEPGIAVFVGPNYGCLECQTRLAVCCSVHQQTSALASTNLAIFRRLLEPDMPRRPRRRPLNKDEMIALWAARGGAPAHYGDPNKYLTEDRYHPVRPVLQNHKTKGWREVNRRDIPLPPPKHHPHWRYYENFDGPAAEHHSRAHGFHRSRLTHTGRPRVRIPAYDQSFWNERNGSAQTKNFGEVQYVGRYGYPRKDRKKAANNIVYVYTTGH